MNRTLTGKQNVVTGFDLTDDLQDYQPSPIFDRYGNPTPETLEAMYETEHGLTETMTLEEFKAELDEIFGSISII